MDFEYWVWLLQVMGSHNLRSLRILEKYEDLKDLYIDLHEDNKPCDLMDSAEYARAKKTPIEHSKKVIEYCEKHEISILTIHSDKYPSRLKSIFNPPILLFCMGDLSFIDDEVAITIVGARSPSDYSLKVAKELCTKLANLGVVIVSGFALGIDSVAHGCALSCKERTVAVLGSGIDYSYPPKNARLKNTIAKRGAVISEFLPGQKPLPPNFPQRNRIMAGLSLGTLVIEASKRSGSLITAELSIQQGRDLFCVPPADIFDERYHGVIKYLREGAIPVFSHLDIVYEYYENFSHKISTIGESSENRSDSLVFSETDPSKRKQSKHRTQTNKLQKLDIPSPERTLVEIPYDELDDEQKRIIELLKDRSLLADEIAVLSQLSIESVTVNLTELELMGLIMPVAGQRFTIKS